MNSRKHRIGSRDGFRSCSWARGDWLCKTEDIGAWLLADVVKLQWIPSPSEGNPGTNSMGNDILAHDDLEDKDQKDMVATRFGSKDSLLRVGAVATPMGLRCIPISSCVTSSG